MGQLQDELKKAFKEKGIDLKVPPKPSASYAKPKNQLSSHKIHHSSGSKAQKSPSALGKDLKKSPIPDKSEVEARIKSQSLASSPSIAPKPVYKKPEKIHEQPKPPWIMLLTKDSAVLLKDRDINVSTLLKEKNYDGISRSICKDPSSNPVELTLGFDFGTSSSKLVIGDIQQDRAFAVPFFKDGGVSRYLLPGVIGKSGVYSFFEGERLYRDLKLSLRDSPDEETVFAVVAFMALAIRHARAWLFSEYESLYKNSFIFWNLAVGIPSDGESSADISAVIKRIASAAWLVAAKEGEINDALINECIDISLSEMDVEVSVCSEIAAQMYAFVSSESFDSRDNNIYMMVDVGAGTLDASTFYVSRSTDGAWRFVTYASSVEFNGSVNLHRARILWLIDTIKKSHPDRVDIVESLASTMKNTDCLAEIPGSLYAYISQMDLQFIDGSQKPDTVFRNKNVSPQVYGVYHQSWRDAGVPKTQLADLPTFYCGGGMRMPFYKNIPELFDRKTPNFSWIHPVPRKLTVPDRLLAPGLKSDDYDRVSVAYGLALMGKGQHVTVNKVSPVDVHEPTIHSDYILYPK